MPPPVPDRAALFDRLDKAMAAPFRGDVAGHEEAGAPLPPVRREEPAVPPSRVPLVVQQAQASQAAAERAVQAAQAAQARRAGIMTDAERAADPRNDRNYTFAIDVTTAHGDRLHGAFTSQIPSDGLLADIANTQDIYLGNRDPEKCAWEDLERAAHLADLPFTLVKAPDWCTPVLQKLSAQDDATVRRALWKEVQDHRNFYFRKGEHARPASPKSGEPDPA